MLGVRTTLLDDRRCEVDLVRLPRLSRADIDPAAAPRLAKFVAFVIAAESRRFDWRRTPLIWAFAFVGVTAIVMAVTGARGIRPGAFLALLVALGVAVFFAKRSLTRRATGSSLAATAVSMGVCGSCAYALRDIPAEADGCVVCPECGAAWGRWRITRPCYGPDKETIGRTPWRLRLCALVPSEKTLLGADARGAYFRMIDKRLRLLPARDRARLGPSRLREIRRATCRVGLWLRWLAAVLPFTVAGFLVATAVMMYTEPRMDVGGTGTLGVTLLLTFAVCLAALGVATVRGHEFASPGRRGAVAATFGLCSACGRDITGLPTDPDGHVTCTGCGAAWKGAPR